MTSSENIKIITKKDFTQFIQNLIHKSNKEIIGVQSKGTRYAFAPLTKPEDLKLNYDVTILPPKKYFLPQMEQLMSYELGKPFEVTKTQPEQPRIIIGMHPYDIIALEQTDKVYLDAQEDDFYKQRRKNTLIIGVDIQNVSDRSFAGSMNTHITDTGFDLMLTDLGNKYAVTIGTPKGKQLLEQHAEYRDAKNLDQKKIQRIREELKNKYTQKLDTPKEKWSNLLVANYDNTLWERQSDKCIECSSCTMVCPTCYCYDVKEDVALNLKTGNRVRTWDGCLLQDFTKVGSGEIFRKDIRDRYRHRFYRKGNYLPERYGFVACVGCGRCAIACLPDIADPCKVINHLSEYQQATDTDRFFIKQPKPKIQEPNPIHVPRSATINKIEKLTDEEILLELQLDDNKSLGHTPGQFVEVSIFGIGEAPISISSPPSPSNTFEIVIRKVGDVTTKLASMRPGDKIGIRGPFGTGFDVAALKGKNLLFVSGGIGIFPTRSLIKHVLNPTQRKHYKDVIFLYGCREPCKVLFKEEVEQWQTQPNVKCKMTVDRCAENECWEGETGVITTLFPKLHFDSNQGEDTVAIVVGPPIFYKFVIKCLKDLNIPDKNIVVSLERRMKCGVGKCGHCQINGIYVCKEGPVFNYADIKDLPEAFE